jgi:hypothetical protein
VLAHPWLITASAKTELTTPATMRSHNNVKQLSRFADSAAQVKKYSQFSNSICILNSAVALIF